MGWSLQPARVVVLLRWRPSSWCMRLHMTTPRSSSSSRRRSCRSRGPRRRRGRRRKWRSWRQSWPATGGAREAPGNLRSLRANEGHARRSRCCPLVPGQDCLEEQEKEEEKEEEEKDEATQETKDKEDFRDSGVWVSCSAAFPDTSTFLSSWYFTMCPSCLQSLIRCLCRMTSTRKLDFTGRRHMWCFRVLRNTWSTVDTSSHASPMCAFCRVFYVKVDADTKERLHSAEYAVSLLSDRMSNNSLKSPTTCLG